MAAWQFSFFVVDKAKMKYEGQIVSEEEIDEYLALGKGFEDVAKRTIANLLKPAKNWSNDTMQFGLLDESCIEISRYENMYEIECRISLYKFNVQVLDMMINFINNIDGVVLIPNIIEADKLLNKLFKATRNNLITLMVNSPMCKLCKNKEELLQYKDRP